MNKLCSLLLLLATATAANAAPNVHGSPAVRCLDRMGAPYHGTIPANMRLLRPCRNADRMDEGEHHWVFTGRTRISGTIGYIGGEWGGYGIRPDAKSASLLPSVVQAVSLEGQQGDLSLHPPGIGDDDAVCMMTTGTIEFSELEVIDDGTEASGDWANQYTVIKLGKWRPCPRHPH